MLVSLRLLTAALLLAAWPAWAQCVGIQCPAGQFASPGYGLDGQPAPTRAYSLRRLLSSYSTNKAINIVRASDSTTADIGFTAAGAFDTATATTFCAATTCKVTRWYDQSGASGDLLQATDASRPSLIFNCLGTAPCIRFTTAAINLTAAGNITPATGVVSLAIVSARPAGTGNCGFLRENGAANRIGGNAAVNSWRLTGGTSGAFNAGALDGPFHSAIGIINGASSGFYVDGALASGTATGSTTAGAPTIVGVASTTCDTVSASIFDNVALTASSAAAMTANQRAFWGF